MGSTPIGITMVTIFRKECPHCKRDLPITSFTYKDKAHTKLSSWCRDCQKEKTLEIRSNNPEKYKKRDREKKAKLYIERRAFIDKYKKSGCIICGESELVCLDFHHVNQEDKSFEIGNYFHIKPIKVVEEEIKKCVILCANCHRKVHAGLVNLDSYGTNIS